MSLTIRNNRLTVYADLNCPFCYALHENLLGMNYLNRVTWQCIEHAPQVNFDRHDIAAISEIKTEVAKVKNLAPDVIINIPAGRPNTHIANQILLEIQQCDPGQANAFRTLLYRALWVEGKNIADTAILEQLLEKLSIPYPEVTQEVRSKLQQWQQEWEQGDFSRNIPALVTAEGNKLLGFPSPQLLTLFIYGDSVNISAENDGICTLHPRDEILLVSNDARLRNNIAAALTDYDIQFCDSNEEAIELSLSDCPPDLIFLDAQAGGFSTCQTISEHTQNLIIPIVLLTSIRDDASEINAFEMGAADFIHKDTSASILNARSRTLLRLKRANDLLDEVAHMDPLTEIPNRREYNRVIDLEWRQSIRMQKPLAIILIDIDHFKKYNDNYGHIEGDKCLHTFARFLQNSIRRPTDLVARYGGEEFVIILPDTDEKGAVQVAQLIKQQLAQLNITHAFSTTAGQLTVSQGVAGNIPTLSDHPKKLVEAADHALYEAKGRGRNQIVTAGSID